MFSLISFLRFFSFFILFFLVSLNVCLADKKIKNDKDKQIKLEQIFSAELEKRMKNNVKEKKQKQKRQDNPKKTGKKLWGLN